MLAKKKGKTHPATLAPSSGIQFEIGKSAVPKAGRPGSLLLLIWFIHVQLQAAACFPCERIARRIRIYPKTAGTLQHGIRKGRAHHLGLGIVSRPIDALPFDFFAGGSRNRQAA